MANGDGPLMSRFGVLIMSVLALATAGGSIELFWAATSASLAGDITIATQYILLAALTFIVGFFTMLVVGSGLVQRQTARNRNNQRNLR